MSGTKDADDGGEDPKCKVLRIAVSEAGDEKSARIEESVQKNTDPKVAYFTEHDGEHGSDQEGIADLQKCCADSRSAEQIQKMIKSE